MSAAPAPVSANENKPAQPGGGVGAAPRVRREHILSFVSPFLLIVLIFLERAKEVLRHSLCIFAIHFKSIDSARQANVGGIHLAPSKSIRPRLPGLGGVKL